MSLDPLMSSANPNWQTPAAVLNPVRCLGGNYIALDPCTTPDNPCNAAAFFTPAVDGLAQDWSAHGGPIYVNPPYGRALPPWVAKCHDEADRGCEIVLLIPARTDTRWWQDHIVSADALCFWRGRLKFVGAKDAAPFPSALVYWGPRPLAFMTEFQPFGWVQNLARNCPVCDAPIEPLQHAAHPLGRHATSHGPLNGRPIAILP